MNEKRKELEDIKAHIANRRMLLAQHPGLVEEYTKELLGEITFWEKRQKELERSGVT